MRIIILQVVVYAYGHFVLYLPQCSSLIVQFLLRLLCTRNSQIPLPHTRFRRSTLYCRDMVCPAIANTVTQRIEDKSSISFATHFHQGVCCDLESRLQPSKCTPYCTHGQSVGVHHPQ
ncbi:hypothetical protein M404DRAFT_759675 [Pisolithus tinctorius Marx 270]|uniref:Uncharacterized protein n=1 Tax=Pisolithus tinctorius Marx 270 TaxID=870435 RepID=A0A0C3NZK0_PISTI|nr:hypothetical protein M404DRAFT_759675 [Pisolithus tinctorius Marx 270]